MQRWFLDMKVAMPRRRPSRWVVTIQGQTFWTGDPGTADPGAFFTSGQYRFDPNNYLSYEAEENNQDFRDVVYASHPDRARCVIRKRVINSQWEFEHPALLVCRP